MGSPRQNLTKHYQKGETIFRAGEPASRCLILQSGLVSIQSARGDHSIELYRAIAPQLIGEEAILSGGSAGPGGRYTCNAVAVNATQALEIPAEEAAQLLASSTGIVKLLTESMIARHGTMVSGLKAIKAEEDPTPCPSDLIGKLFGTITCVASHNGTKKGEELTVSWPAFRKYCQRIFLESPVRLEQAIYLLLRLGYARLEMVKSETDPEAPDELGFVHFKKMQVLEEFAAFCRAKIARTESPLPLSKIIDSVASERPEFIKILEEIEVWNKKGRVEGSPPPASMDLKKPSSGKK